ncbi:hypothetical protein L3X38_038678 [Prunus dulcis]|uniref:Uncharacterized protein n=1 Tax=Prunus dulcis TaxID=3755 RepID=A0AAD4YRR1_PRUDU|nr:hypothetical protein L3X38_038678 [Prunus dulcis]
MSISWSRLLPNGTLSGGVNMDGIIYYNNFINELIHNGLTPFVTIFHWDLPQALDDEYGGFLSPKIVINSYAYGSHAPGRCSTWQNLNCTGITLVSPWFEPASEAITDINATFRALDFILGWFMDPLTNGDYPHSMRSNVRERIPKFTEEESELLKESFDFIGINYCTARYASNERGIISARASYLTDSHVNITTELNEVPIGPQAASDWLYVYPKGIHDLVLYTKEKYNNPIIYTLLRMVINSFKLSLIVSLPFHIYNGVDEFNDPKLPLEQALNDTERIDYYYHHLCYLHASTRKGAKVKGYFAWSLLDNFEWNDGYTVRFGIT